MNMSPVTIVGNLTRDPEEFTFASGATKVTFSVAVENRYMKNQEWVSDTSFFNVVAWKFQAEDAARVLEKGVRVIVVGRLDQRSWQSDDGTNRSTIEIVADEIAVANSATLRETLSRMLGQGLKSIPVVDDGNRLVGEVALSDIEAATAEAES